MKIKTLFALLISVLLCACSSNKQVCNIGFKGGPGKSITKVDSGIVLRKQQSNLQETATPEPKEKINKYTEALQKINPLKNKSLLKNYPKLKIEFPKNFKDELRGIDSVKKEIKVPLGKDAKEYLGLTLLLQFILILTILALAVLTVLILAVVLFLVLFFVTPDLQLLLFFGSFFLIPFIGIILIAMIIPLGYISAIPFMKFLDFWGASLTLKNILGVLTLLLAIGLAFASCLFFTIYFTTIASALTIGIVLAVLALFASFYALGFILFWIFNLVRYLLDKKPKPKSI
ncbi:MAG: hypothetical protein NTX03_07355 [Bacteroidetes bacterium]|nr:hypothetical protein [Bacteroidota bacterium]